MARRLKSRNTRISAADARLLLSDAAGLLQHCEDLDNSLRTALDEVDACEHALSESSEQTAGKLAHLGRYHRALRRLLVPFRHVVERPGAFHFSRAALLRVSLLATVLWKRMDDTATKIGGSLAALRVAERFKTTRQRIANAESAFQQGNFRRVIEAGEALSMHADKLHSVIQLIGGITSADYGTAANPDVERYFREFEALLEDDYRRFASEENYPQEADAYADLRRMFDEMSELRLAPRLASRNICAVAGGFSSGKSSFLNALIGGDEEILPTQITPTTAIPTYIFHVDGELSVNAFNHHGGSVEIAASLFQEMTHSFRRSYGIELKRLVHRVSIYTPALSCSKNLAFIDTPGYTNPEEMGGGNRDEDIALANMLKAHFLIWVVDCEKGTIPEQDIHFIRKFLSSDADRARKGRIYLVLNKGDKKTAQQRKDILNVAKETARKHKVPLAGIGVYSSHEKEWYAHSDSSFEAFLTRVNKARQGGTRKLGKEVANVFQRYVSYHGEEGDQLRKASGLLNRLALALTSDVAGDGKPTKLGADLSARRAYIRRELANHERLEKEARRLQERFSSCVTSFVDSIAAMKGVR